MIRFFHKYGFFSFCSRFLEELVLFMNTHKRAATNDEIDVRENLDLYKPQGAEHRSVFHDFFQPAFGTLSYKHPISFSNNDQFKLFYSLPLGDLLPFVREYFQPTEEIQQIQQLIEDEFHLQDYSNICCLFYRGNDKVTEMKLSSYDEYIRIGSKILSYNPETTFLVQSDETEFITAMVQAFPRTIVLHGYIRHIPRHGGSQVDKLNHPSANYEAIKRYIAITKIMGKCNQIVTQSGNCGLWIILLRGSAKGVHQFVDGKWYMDEWMFEKDMANYKLGVY